MVDYLKIVGCVVFDVGVVQKLSLEGKLLLFIGVVEVLGEFGWGDVIICVDESGCVIVCGMSNYNSLDVWCIICYFFFEIQVIFGFVEELELVYWDNLVLL